MRRRTPTVPLLALAAALALAGCRGGPPDDSARSDLFDARSLRIHPVFTKILDWTGEGRPDGIETLIELDDRFGDPTKAAGTYLFELYSYRPGYPDPRGSRLYNPWSASVVTEDEQRERWSKTGRSYTFRLQADGISLAGPYVFAATFTPVGGGPRLFDRVVLGQTSATTQRAGREESDNVIGAPPPSSESQRLPEDARPPTQ